MNKNSLLLFLSLAFFCANAQKDSVDSLPAPVKKTHYKYMGIQANLLLQQFISFNSNSSINSNPYLFCYAKNNLKSGRGFTFGTGFNISENSSNDGVSSNTVQNINATFRFGSEKKFLQAEKFIPFIGVDIGFGGTYNRVTSQLNQSFSSSSTTVETTKAFFGPSFRAGLLFSLSKHILLGTEFFFNAQVVYSEVNSGVSGNSTSVAPLNIGFQAPTALFLIFKY